MKNPTGTATAPHGPQADILAVLEADDTYCEKERGQSKEKPKVIPKVAKADPDPADEVPPPPPPREPVQIKQALTPEMQASLLACVMAAPAKFNFGTGEDLTGLMVGSPPVLAAYHAFINLFQKTPMPSLRAIEDQACRSYFEHYCKEEDQQLQFKDELFDFLSLVKGTAVEADTPVLLSNLRRWIAEARRDRALALYTDKLSQYQAEPGATGLLKEIKQAEDALLQALMDVTDVRGGGTLPAIVDCATEPALPLPDVQVEGLIHEGTKVVFGGSSKTRKTWSLLDLAVSVATGSKWWGRKTKQGRVLYINFEVAAPFFQNRLRAVLKTKGVVLKPGQLDHYCLRGFAGAAENVLPDIMLKVRHCGYKMIVLDPTYKLMGGKRDENKAGDIASLLNEIEKLSVATGATAVTGAHYSKGNQSMKESLDRVSGSGVFARDPDTYLAFDAHKEEDVFVLEPTLRNFPPAPKFCIRWSYPLMELAPDCDPDELKPKRGGPGQKFDNSALLKVLIQMQRVVSRSEWLAEVMRLRPRGTYDPETGVSISKPTFNKRVKALLQLGKIVEDEDGFRPQDELARMSCEPKLAKLA